MISYMCELYSDNTDEISRESTDECPKIKPSFLGFEFQLQRLARSFPEYDFRTILSKYYNDGIDSEDPVLTAIPAFPDGVSFTIA
jgi:hypothetical protein